MRKVEFIKDFATKKKGEVGEYDGTLSTRLISKGVARIPKVKKPRKKKAE